MIRIRRYDNEFPAQQAAQWLRRHGVNAQVVNLHVNSTLGVTGLRFAQIHLVIPHKSLRGQAEELLEEFEQEAAQPDGDWENVAPNLELLDAAAYPVSCPDCGADLPLDPSVEACPACASEVDVVDLLVRAYGPDVLAECYEDESTAVDENLPRVAFCRECGYNLTGLAARGRCPECGGLYDKDELDRTA